MCKTYMKHIWVSRRIQTPGFDLALSPHLCRPRVLICRRHFGQGVGKGKAREGGGGYRSPVPIPRLAAHQDAHKPVPDLAGR